MRPTDPPSTTAEITQALRKLTLRQIRRLHRQLKKRGRLKTTPPTRKEPTP